MIGPYDGPDPYEDLHPYEDEIEEGPEEGPEDGYWEEPDPLPYALELWALDGVV